jgi:hypothetical protein
MYVKNISLVLIYNISCNKNKLFRLHRRSRTNNELIYESKRVLQITTPFKDKVFRLADCSSVKKKEDTQEVLSKLWSKNDSLFNLGSVLLP